MLMQVNLYSIHSIALSKPFFGRSSIPGASDLPWQRLEPRKQRRSSICAAFMATSKNLMRTHRSFGPFMPLRFSLLTRLPSEIFNVCSAVSEGLAEVQRTGDLSPEDRRGFVEIVEHDTKGTSIPDNAETNRDRKSTR